MPKVARLGRKSRLKDRREKEKSSALQSRLRFRIGATRLFRTFLLTLAATMISHAACPTLGCLLTDARLDDRQTKFLEEAETN